VSPTVQFRAAVETRDHAAITTLLAEDVRVFSPVTFLPFEGIRAVSALFAVLLRTFEDFRYVGAFSGSLTEDNDGEAHILVFRARVGDKQIHGIDQLQFDQSGMISKRTVMVRPLSAATALNNAVMAGLQAGGARSAQEAG